MSTTTQWPCPHCQKPYTHVDALLIHIKKIHPNAPLKKR